MNTVKRILEDKVRKAFINHFEKLGEDDVDACESALAKAISAITERASGSEQGQLKGVNMFLQKNSKDLYFEGILKGKCKVEDLFLAENRWKWLSLRKQKEKKKEDKKSLLGQVLPEQPAQFITKNKKGEEVRTMTLKGSDEEGNIAHHFGGYEAVCQSFGGLLLANYLTMGSEEDEKNEVEEEADDDGEEYGDAQKADTAREESDMGTNQRVDRRGEAHGRDIRGQITAPPRRRPPSISRRDISLSAQYRKERRSIKTIQSGEEPVLSKPKKASTSTNQLRDEPTYEHEQYEEHYSDSDYEMDESNTPGVSEAERQNRYAKSIINMESYKKRKATMPTQRLQEASFGGSDDERSYEQSKRLPESLSIQFPGPVGRHTLDMYPHVFGHRTIRENKLIVRISPGQFLPELKLTVVSSLGDESLSNSILSSVVSVRSKIPLNQVRQRLLESSQGDYSIFVTFSKAPEMINPNNPSSEKIASAVHSYLAFYHLLSCDKGVFSCWNNFAKRPKFLYLMTFQNVVDLLGLQLNNHFPLLFGLVFIVSKELVENKQAVREATESEKMQRIWNENADKLKREDFRTMDTFESARTMLRSGQELEAIPKHYFRDDGPSEDDEW
eukprot:Nk52_evm22s1129 gene=Nk52_evmTU22s1129